MSDFYLDLNELFNFFEPNKKAQVVKTIIQVILKEIPMADNNPPIAMAMEDKPISVEGNLMISVIKL